MSGLRSVSALGLVFLVAAATASGCAGATTRKAASVQVGQPSASTVPPNASPSFVLAGAGSGGAWLLRRTSLEVTRDGGADWSALSPPTATEPITDVSVLGDRTVAVGSKRGDTTLSVYIHEKGSSTWQARQLVLEAPMQSAEIVASSGSLVGIMVTEDGGNRSAGEWIGTADDGATWEAHAAPVGGVVTDVSGSLWLVGGTSSTLVYTSPDGGHTWNRADLPAPSGAGASPAYGPVEPDGAGVVLTATTAGSGTVQLVEGSPSGGYFTWTEGPAIATGGQFGAGAPADSSFAAGTLWVLGPGTSVARVALATGHVSAAIPKGAPENGSIAVYATSSTSAWAVYSTYDCASGKSDCVAASGIVSTVDGGRSWAPVALPAP